ncbi:MAG: carotenoid oxygenase family protein, partial [Gammaproteobacteria bacterium]|nr:carotenoid oxygenase family protein [Gammaproteobacteria bacterium]
TMQELARVRLPFRNPMQVHGAWVDADILDLA